MPSKLEAKKPSGTKASPARDPTAASASSPDKPTATLESENSEAQALAEAAAKAQAAADAEAERIWKERDNGTIKLIYEQYDDDFPIVDGSTTQANIDEVYCLSFVMPTCLVHLSHYPSAERFARENAGVFDSLVAEEPRGVFQGLTRDTTYYIVVEQEADQLRRDQETTRAKWDPELKQQKRLVDMDDGRGFETCSCVYGSPCVDEYGCKDWHARFATATANGWKGF